MDRELLAKAYSADPDLIHAEFVKALEGMPTAGPVIAAIIALIKQGVTHLPDILAALQAAGMVLPPWVTIIITLLLAIIKPPAPKV